MTTKHLFSYLTFIGFIYFFIHTAWYRQTFYADVQAGIESGRALITADESTYDFHTWRPVGHVISNALTAWLFGIDHMMRSTALISVVLTILSILGIARIAHLWSQNALISIIISCTTPLIIHYTNSGVTDIHHFAFFILALLALTDPLFKNYPRLQLFFFLLFVTCASASRPTLFGLGVTLLFAHDWSQRKIKSIILRQCSLGLFILLTVCAQLFLLIAMRGREYGWLTFKRMYSGLVQSHTSSVLFDNPLSFGDGILQIFYSYGGALFIIFLVSIVYSFKHKTPWLRYALAWVVWALIHLWLVQNYQARYYITGLMIAIPCALAFISQLKIRVKSFLIYFLIFYNLFYSLPILFHQWNLAQFTPINKLVLDDIKSWSPKRVFFRGQYFSQHFDQAPWWNNDPFTGIYSIDRSSFNLFMRTRVKQWHVTKPIDWSALDNWDQGLVDPLMSAYIPNAVLDGDIFIISPTQHVYLQNNIPPIAKSLKELQSIHPNQLKQGEFPTHQMPLIVERLRRHRIKPGPQGWQAGPLILKGSDPTSWSGWPKAGRIEKIGPHFDLIWTDRLILYHREGKMYSWSFDEKKHNTHFQKN